MRVLLKDACLIIMGQSPDSKSYNKHGNGLPFYQGNADFGDVHPITRVWCDNPIKIAEEGDILISVRAPIGSMNIATMKCCIGRGLAALRPIEGCINNQFLYYALESKIDLLIEQGTGSTFKAIGKSILENTEIPYYTLEEQISIAGKLNKIAKAIAIKNDQLERLDQVIKSRFIEMFSLQKEAFSSCTLDTVSSKIFAGGDRPKETSENKNEEFQYPVFANAETNKGLLCYSKSYQVELPCVTIAARGCTVGYTEVRNEKFTPVVRLITIIPTNEITPLFLKYYLDLEMKIEGNGAAQPQLTVPTVKKYQIYVPPLTLQNQFASFVQQIDKSKYDVTLRIKLALFEFLHSQKLFFVSC